MTKPETEQSIDNQGSSPNGLLWQFIVEKVAAYTPPTRKGTQRGETIGFPSKKYRMVLLTALTGANLNNLAEEFSIHRSVLGKWCIEPGFQQLGLELREEYTSRFIKRIWSCYEHGGIEELELGDKYLYHPALIIDINNRIRTDTRGADFSTTLFGCLVICLLLSSFRRFLSSASPTTQALVRKLNHEILRGLSLIGLRLTKSLLQLPEDPTPEHRQLAIHSLDQVGAFIEGLPSEAKTVNQ